MDGYKGRRFAHSNFIFIKENSGNLKSVVSLCDNHVQTDHLFCQVMKEVAL